MKTLIGIPCMDTVPTGFMLSLLHLVKGSDVSVYAPMNSLVYDSRNLICLNAIENNYDRVMWFDSDMMFTPATMQMLHADLDGKSSMGDDSLTDFHGCDMVTGLYFQRRPPYLPVIFDQIDEPAENADGQIVARVHKHETFPHNTLFPVSGCGMGCCMTSVKLLKDVWDKFGPAFSPYPWAGEDISFCHRVNQLGYQIWCDSRITCGHIGQFIYTEDTYKAKRGDAH